MISKEWRDARWKFLIAAVVVLTFVVFALRPYGAILETAEFQIEMAMEELESPEAFIEPGMQPPPGYDPARAEERLRDNIEEMRQPDFPVKMAGYELMDLHAGVSYVVLVPLAALLGVALVSGEVSRGTVFLLLSQPISHTRILLTKYSVGLATLLAVALLGVVVVVASGYARGYPAAAIDLAGVLSQAGLFWLGTVSVLGLALLASVLFRDVIRSVVATAVALYAIFSLPDLLMGIAWWLSPPSQEEIEGPMMRNWYDSFEAFRITNYWSIRDVYEDYGGPFANQQPDPVLSLLVCLATAVAPLLVALWLFRRKNY